ncbi:MAG: PD-(D/E)XK nuclease family protein [Bacteroidota bacterium]
MSLFERYQEVLEASLPETDEKKTTLLDISGFPDYENVISNLYAYFLDEKQAHGLKRLFLDGLTSCLGLEILFDSYEVNREVSTGKGRLDLVIEEKESDTNKVLKAIGIENKIFHVLNNDLTDYTMRVSEANEYAMVVLMLDRPTKEQNGVHYITHQQWMHEVKKLMGNYILEADPKALLQLTDFIQHIENYYKKIMDKDGLDFLHQYGQKISELKELETDGLNQLLDSMRNSLAANDNYAWDAKIPSGLRMTYLVKDHLVYLYTNRIFNEHTISFELWIKRTEKNKKKYTPELISKIYEDFNLGAEEYHEKGYYYIKEEECKSMTEKDLANFGDFVLQKIDQELLPLIEAIEKGANG